MINTITVKLNYTGGYPMKALSMIFYGAFAAVLLTACSAQENHENTAETHSPTPYATESATEGVVDSVMDGAGNVIDDTGNIVEDAGNAVNDAAHDVGNAMKD